MSQHALFSFFLMKAITDTYVSQFPRTTAQTTELNDLY